MTIAPPTDRVPASSAILGRAMTCSRRRSRCILELEVEETGEFSLDPAALDVSTGRDNLIVRAFESRTLPTASLSA